MEIESCGRCSTARKLCSDLSCINRGVAFWYERWKVVYEGRVLGLNCCREQMVGQGGGVGCHAAGGNEDIMERGGLGLVREERRIWGQYVRL